MCVLETSLVFFSSSLYVCVQARIFFDLLSDVITRKVMSVNKRLLFSSLINHTWPKYLHERHLKIFGNYTDQHIRLSSDSSWIIHRFTIVQRSFFILSLVSSSPLDSNQRRKKGYLSLSDEYPLS